MRVTTERTMYELLLGSMTLEHHVLAECLAMAKYAFSSGMIVPGWLAERLDAIATQVLQKEVKSSMTVDMLDAELDAEAEGELSVLPAEVNPTNPLKELSTIHRNLAEIILPATPRTILLLASESARAGLWRFLGPVRLVRGLVLMALMCLASFVALATSADVNTVSVSKNILEIHGFPLLLNLLFLLTAAALGACFAALFQANRFIAEGTFDPKYESSYWIRVILGLIAGLLLSHMVPLTNDDISILSVTKPMLALLGGFSAAMVYRIIRRLIEAVESLVKGEGREATAVQEQTAQARLSAQSAQSRLQLVAGLTNLQQHLAAQASPETLRLELERIMGNLLLPDEERVR
jgi:hypothetical protein